MFLVSQTWLQKPRCGQCGYIHALYTVYDITSVSEVSEIHHMSDVLKTNISVFHFFFFDTFYTKKIGSGHLKANAEGKVKTPLRSV